MDFQNVTLDKEQIEIIEDTMETFNIPLDPRKWNQKNIDDWFYWTKHRYRYKCPKMKKESLNVVANYQEALNPSIWQSVYGSDAGSILFNEFRDWLTYRNEKIQKPKLIPNSYRRINQKPRRRNEKKYGLYLWQILLRMLCEPKQYCDVIVWVDKTRGTFKFKNPTEAARIWGASKNNNHMTYDKMSRSMRQYYKSNLLKKENNDKLNYRFNMEDRSVQQFLERCYSNNMPPLLSNNNNFTVNHNKNNLGTLFINKHNNIGISEPEGKLNPFYKYRIINKEDNNSNNNNNKDEVYCNDKNEDDFDSESLPFSPSHPGYIPINNSSSNNVLGDNNTDSSNSITDVNNSRNLHNINYQFELDLIRTKS